MLLPNAAKGTVLARIWTRVHSSQLDPTIVITLVSISDVLNCFQNKQVCTIVVVPAEIVGKNSVMILNDGKLKVHKEEKAIRFVQYSNV